MDKTRRMVISAIRDILSLIMCLTITIATTFYIYASGDQSMSYLKNLIFPFHYALMLDVLISIGLVFSNRVSTLIALKIVSKMKG